MRNFENNIVAYLICMIGAVVFFVMGACGIAPAYLLGLFALACGFCILIANLDEK